jgi:hypothetical protein
MTSTPAPQPIRASNCPQPTHHFANCLMDKLRASYVAPLAQPVPCRLTAIIYRLPRS